MPDPALTITMARNEAAVAKGGSGFFWLKKVTGAGADLTVPDAVHTGFVGKSSGFASASQDETDKDEGRNVYVVSQTHSGQFEITSMQFDLGTLNLDTALANSYCQVLKLLNEQPINGKRLWQLIPIAQYTGGGGYKDGIVQPFKFSAVKAPADIAITLDSTTAPGCRGFVPAGTITCYAGNFCGYLEQ